MSNDTECISPSFIGLCKRLLNPDYTAHKSLSAVLTQSSCKPLGKAPSLVIKIISYGKYLPVSWFSVPFLEGDGVVYIYGTRSLATKSWIDQCFVRKIISCGCSHRWDRRHLSAHSTFCCTFNSNIRWKKCNSRGQRVRVSLHITLCPA